MSMDASASASAEAIFSRRHSLCNTQLFKPFPAVMILLCLSEEEDVTDTPSDPLESMVNTSLSTTLMATAGTAGLTSLR